MGGVFWFDLAVADLERAMAFYGTIFDTTLTAQPGMGDTRVAMLPGMGTLVQGGDYVPGPHGMLVYLDADPDLQVILDRVEPAGGKVTMSKNSWGDYGFMAYFEDTEGNKIGLHSSG
jgi:predicted enzyme related to lactoylglutathione lyase